MTVAKNCFRFASSIYLPTAAHQQLKNQFLVLSAFSPSLI
jgi:hypothetical protein